MFFFMVVVVKMIRFVLGFALKAYFFTTDNENIVDRIYNTHDNHINESGRLSLVFRFAYVSCS